MYKCNVCDLRVQSIGALEQHERDSSKHAAGMQLQQHQQGRDSPSKTFACQPCRRHFRTIDALQQHIEASPHHVAPVLQRSAPGPSSMAVKIECGTCKRQFDSNCALLLHQRESPGHTTKALQYSAQHSAGGVKSTAFEPRGRQFANAEALQQHERGLPARATGASQESVLKVTTSPSTFYNRSTVSRELDCANQSQRLNRRHQDSTKRPVIFPCSQCNQSFGSDNTLQVHTQSAHVQPENSPWSMHPGLHGEVSQRLEANGLSVGFYEEGEPEDSIRDYDTNVMGAFTCPNRSCRIQRWTSNLIAISIQLYEDEEYNAIVWHQRCQKCEDMGILELDVQSYVDRVVYRLGKWLGLDAAVPPYSEKIKNRPHKQELCEGCKSGHCQRGKGGFA